DGEAAPAPVGDTAAPGRAVDALDWDALAQCLSSGDPEAVSADQQHHGLFQFSVEVWESVGGSGLPSEAPPAEQLERAKALYEKFGPGQWPTCANHLCPLACDPDPAGAPCCAALAVVPQSAQRFRSSPG